MDLTLLDNRSKIIILILFIAQYIIAFLVGYKRGKKGIFEKTMGTILVNPKTDLKNRNPDFSMKISPEFIDLAYSTTLGSKTKYVIFEVKEGSINENNGLL